MQAYVCIANMFMLNRRQGLLISPLALNIFFKYMYSEMSFVSYFNYRYSYTYGQ